MKILYYNCFAGISGDMNLGAMLDLGIEEQYLISELKKLNLHNYSIQVQKEKRNGIAGTKVVVRIDSESHKQHDSSKPSPTTNHMTDHDHHHNHLHHTHPEHTSVHSHHERNLQDIIDIIQTSSLSEQIKKTSCAIFSRLAHAEAHVHDTSIDQIHFHEVGAIDSIIDIVGAAICYHASEVDAILSGPIELGGGFVTCKHGVLPIPAPATSELVKGMPVTLGAVPFETTTPTGAAILSVLVNRFESQPSLKIESCGHGIGHRLLTIPNILRVYKAEILDETTQQIQSNTACMIECNIDDMNPEILEHVIELLFLEGADDVFLTPIIMKKSRPGTLLNVLCNQSRFNRLSEIIFTETSTMGIRHYQVEKSMLQRRIHTLQTPFGPIQIKTALFNGQELKHKPEYEQCKAIARATKIPLPKIYQEIYQILSSQNLQNKDASDA